MATLLLAELFLLTIGEFYEDEMFKLVATTSILFSCGTIITPIFALVEMLARRPGRRR